MPQTGTNPVSLGLAQVLKDERSTHVLLKALEQYGLPGKQIDFLFVLQCSCALIGSDNRLPDTSTRRRTIS